MTLEDREEYVAAVWAAGWNDEQDIREFLEAVLPLIERDMIELLRRESLAQDLREYWAHALSQRIVELEASRERLRRFATHVADGHDNGCDTCEWSFEKLGKDGDL